MVRDLALVIGYLLCLPLLHTRLAGADCSSYGPELVTCRCASTADRALLEATCVGKGLNRIPQLAPPFPNVSRSFVYNMSRNFILHVDSGELSWLAGRGIRAIDLSRNQIRSINANAFSGITSDLLDLSGNFIVALSCEAFQNFISTVFMMSDNEIIDACNFTKCMTSGNQNIRIDLRNNSIGVLRSGCFSQLASSLSVDLSSNRVSFFDEDTLVNTTVVAFDISNNNISESMLSGLMAMFSKAKGGNITRQLVMTNNRIKSIDVLCNQSQVFEYALDFNAISSVPAGCAAKLFRYNATVIRLTNNALDTITENFTRGMELFSDLQLQSNSLRHVERYAFQSLKSLLRLNLSHSLLGSVDSTFFDALCSSGSNVMELDLSYNSISSLPAHWHDNCASLLSLRLAGNRLVAVSKEMFAPSLTVLTLHHNNISTIYPGTFVKLPRLLSLDLSFNNMSKLDVSDYNGSTKYLYVTGNPFSCSCELVEWLSSMHETDFNTATCIYEQKTQAMGHFLTQSCTVYLSPTSPGFSEAKVAGIIVSTTLLMLSIVGAVWFVLRRRSKCITYGKATGYNAMDDGDPTFSDTQGFKFTAKPDRLQLLTT